MARGSHRALTAVLVGLAALCVVDALRIRVREPAPPSSQAAAQAADAAGASQETQNSASQGSQNDASTQTAESSSAASGTGTQNVVENKGAMVKTKEGSDPQADAARRTARRFLGDRLGHIRVVHNVNHLRHWDQHVAPAVAPKQDTIDYEAAQQERMNAAQQRVIEREAATKQNAALMETLRNKDADESAQKEDFLQKSKEESQKKMGCSVIDSTVPGLYARWNFEKDTKDVVGIVHLTAEGSAAVDNKGAIKLTGGGSLRSSALPFALTEKTLEVWVKLDTLDQKTAGVMGVQRQDDKVWDSIVYGQISDRIWTAGSEDFKRTDKNDKSGGATAESVAGEFVHMAITYAKDGTITMYRNGAKYKTGYKPPTASLETYSSDSQVILGRIHGNQGPLGGSIAEARLYIAALTGEQIHASYQAYQKCENKA